MARRSIFLSMIFASFFSAVFSSGLFIGPTPDNLEAVVINLINRAKSRIWIVLYRLTNASVVHALVQAKQRGVNIHIILDKGMLDVPAYSLVRRKCGAARIPLFFNKQPSLMHHKWAIFDNALFLGSANWTKAGLTRNHEQCMYLGDKKSVQIAATHFIALMRRVSGLNAVSPRYSNSFFFMPEHARAAKRELMNAIAGAKRCVLITMYALTSKWCINALVAARARRVDVRMVLEPTQIVDLRIYKSNKSVGWIKKYKPPAGGGILHDKCAIIDDDLWLGSMNWTGAGMRSNDESLMRVNDKSAVMKAKISFERLWKTAVN